MSIIKSVTLVAEGVECVVPVNKLICCSDYFKAMYSGSYLENMDDEKTQLPIVSAFALKAISHFLHYDNLPDILEIPDLLELARCAMYLQIKSLMDIVNWEIIKHTTIQNWVAIYTYASTVDLQHILCGARNFGLANFYSFKSEITTINDIEFLHWYLSHTDLKIDAEFDVFVAGVYWLIKKGDSKINNILAVLHSLDFYKLSIQEIKKISQHELVLRNHTAKALLDHVIIIRENNILCRGKSLDDLKDILGTSQQDKKIFEEVTINLMLKSKMRKKPAKEFVYFKWMTHKNDCSKTDTTVTNDTLPWGQSYVCWRGIYLLLVCGQKLKSDEQRFRYECGEFNMMVKLYDNVYKTWRVIGNMAEGDVKPRRHAGVAIDGDFLYIVGGTGQFRKRLDSAWVFKITENSWRRLPDLPVGNSASKILISAHKHFLFAYGNTLMMLNLKSTNYWQQICLEYQDLFISSMIFFNDHLYFTSNRFANYMLACYDMSTNKQFQLKIICSLDNDGDIKHLCFEGSSLYVYYKVDVRKYTIIKINLNNPNPEFEEDVSPGCLCDLTENSGLFVMNIFDDIDDHITTYDKNWS